MENQFILKTFIGPVVGFISSDQKPRIANLIVIPKLES